MGVSIEWQAFQLPHAFEWSRSFHPDSLELCLNLAGHGSVGCGESVLNFEPLVAGFYLPGRRALQAWRDASHAHRFLTVEFSSRFLRQQLSKCDGALHPLVEDFVRGGPPRARLGELHRLSAAQEQRIAHLLHPPVLQGARPIWYQGKVLECMAEFFFERRGEDELFCDRQKRLARERADRVVALLRQHLAEPLSLEAIGREVGCSPFHLSRTFSAETGMTIPQYLRKLRMERAAELLAERQIQCDGGGAGSGLFQPQPFQPEFLPDNGLLSWLVSAKDNSSRGFERQSRTLPHERAIHR